MSSPSSFAFSASRSDCKSRIGLHWACADARARL